jgi:hypothetical protein
MADMVTLICEQCGNDKTFKGDPPAHLVCERCGGTVWEVFVDPRPSDAVAEDYLESTARDITLDDVSPDITRADRPDLNNP